MKIKTIAIVKGLLLGAALIAIASITSCTAPASWVGTPNPLDEPGASPATAEELHLKNLRNITGNPCYK